MANENFASYDETDESDNVTVTSGKVSWVDLDRDEASHVSDSKGAAHFSGDFTHKFECCIEASVDKAAFSFWALANAQANLNDLLAGEENGMMFGFLNVAGALWLRLFVMESGSLLIDSWTEAQVGVKYFVTVKRDDDGGVYSTGRLTAEIRTGSHTGELRDILQVDSAAGEQNDFEFVFALMSSGSAYEDKLGTGYTQNLELEEVTAEVVISGEPDKVKWRGVRPVTGISGIWPQRNAERVAAHHLQDGSGVRNVYTVAAAKRLFLTSALLSTLLSSEQSSRAIMAVRDGEDDFLFYVLYQGFFVAGQQTTGMGYVPALELEAGWDLYIESTHADMMVRGLIFGWLEDA